MALDLHHEAGIVCLCESPRRFQYLFEGFLKIRKQRSMAIEVAAAYHLEAVRYLIQIRQKTSCRALANLLADVDDQEFEKRIKAADKAIRGLVKKGNVEPGDHSADMHRREVEFCPVPLLPAPSL